MVQSTVRSDQTTVLTTIFHQHFSKEGVYTCCNNVEMGSTNSLHALGNTASIQKLIGGIELENCFDKNVDVFEDFRLTLCKKKGQNGERRKRRDYF